MPRLRLCIAVVLVQAIPISEVAKPVNTAVSGLPTRQCTSQLAEERGIRLAEQTGRELAIKAQPIDTC